MSKTKIIFPLALTALSMMFVTSDVFAKPTKSAVKTDNTAKSEKKESTTQPAFKQVSNAVPHLGVNWDLYAGYGFSDWSRFTGDGHGAWANIGAISPRSHTKGGFNIGGDLGYQIIRYLGMEFGYYHFKKVAGDGLSVETPYVYGAAKIGYPFLANDDLSIFAKIGLAYRMIEYGGGARQGVYNNKRYSFNLLYGLGVQYYFSHRWKVSAQWLEIPKDTDGARNTKTSSRQVPRTDQVLLGLGYLFTI